MSFNNQCRELVTRLESAHRMAKDLDRQLEGFLGDTFPATPTRGRLDAINLVVDAKSKLLPVTNRLGDAAVYLRHSYSLAFKDD